MHRQLSLVATLWVCSMSAVSGAAWAQAPDGASARFSSWAERYAAASSPETRAALAPQGLGLARARRAELARLVARDPERAVALALPPRLARALPPDIAAALEERVDAVGSLEVLALCNRTAGAPSRIERTARIGGRTYRVHAYGAALSLHTRAAVPLHGIALDGELALLDSPLRRLEDGERPDPRKPVASRQGRIAFDAGDAVYFLDEKQATATAERVNRVLRVPGPTPQPSPWTVGTKKALYIRVDFSDAPGDPVSSSTATAAMASVNTFLHASSYDLLTLQTTVTPTFRMPQTKASYESGNAYTQLMDDARAAATTGGFNNASYDFDLIVFREMVSWGWAGLGYVGGKGLWLNGSYTWNTAAHELGHNLGLSHANFWQAPGETIIGAGASVEYGNPFDIMGSGDGQYGAWDKTLLDWIPSGDVAVAAGKSSYRIYDLEALTTGGLHAVRVPISSLKDYWIEFRPNGGAALTDAAVINWGYPSPDVSNLLDMSPWSATASDSPLLIGRTFADPGSFIYITPTGKPGTSPESLDVAVTVGFQATNQPPTVSLGASATQVAKGQSVTFTATAADPDGDPLAYYWDFADGSGSSNSATQSRSWPTDLDVVARVTVTDTRGGTASASLVVRVGNPGTFRISGQALENGSGVEDVKVLTGNRYTFTDSSGAYSLVGLPAGSFAVSAAKAGWTLTASGFTNPVPVTNANVSGINFMGSRATYSVSGTVTSGGTGLSGVTLSAGTYSALTNGNGDFVIGGVPNGTYALSASLAGRTFVAQGFANPVQVNGANLTGKNFTELVFDVSGEVTGAAGPHTVTDGVRTATTALSGGRWLYTLARVPPGNWNVVGTAPGLTLTPSFANPVAVTNAALPGKNFAAAAGTSWLVTGFIQEGGRPLEGVVVDGGTAVSTTDTLGNYALTGVVDGAYTLTPYLPGYQFNPAALAVTVAGADSTGNDFGVLNANSPPTVVIPARASANPVTGNTVTVSVLGDDDDGEAHLTYTWNALFATAPVTYAQNGTNAAKSTQVTFTNTGAYTFEVTITDLGNLKVKSQVTVLVSQAAMAVTVAPATATVQLGSTKQFLATLLDQFADPIDLPDLPAWSVSGGGTLTPVGLFTATAAGGPFTVSASLGGQTGTAQATVVVGPVPRIVQAAAAEPNPVAGDLTRLTVLGDDDGARRSSPTTGTR